MPGREITPQEYFDSLAQKLNYGERKFSGLKDRGLVDTSYLTPLSLDKLFMNLKNRRSMYRSEQRPLTSAEFKQAMKNVNLANASEELPDY